MSEMVKPKVSQAVNDNPVLLSMLYDFGLLPEQIDTKLKAQILATVVAAFLAGKEAQRAKWQEQE